MTHHSLAIRYALVVTILIISIFISLCVGATMYNPVKVINSLLIQDDFILNEYRIPRTLLGLIVGSSLAISGTIIQGVVKNPLASPDVIGMTKGASFSQCSFNHFTYGFICWCINNQFNFIFFNISI